MIQQGKTKYLYVFIAWYIEIYHRISISSILYIHIPTRGHRIWIMLSGHFDGRQPFCAEKLLRWEDYICDKISELKPSEILLRLGSKSWILSARNTPKIIEKWGKCDTFVIYRYHDICIKVVWILRIFKQFLSLVRIKAALYVMNQLFLFLSFFQGL
jgi:hypothetical protein